VGRISLIIIITIIIVLSFTVVAGVVCVARERHGVKSCALRKVPFCVVHLK
jgi:hypothetical protein